MNPASVPRLRPITPADVDAVLDLNERNVEVLSPLDAHRLAALQGWADRADVLDVDGEVAGFVLTFGPGSDYDGGYYRWFAERHGPDFYYLDRIVLDDRFRRQGLGSIVYDEVERAAAPFGRLALEVNSRPPNEASLAFHAGRGFVPVGELVDGPKAVAMLVKELSA